MEFIKSTLSLCPVCLAEIPATVCDIDGQAVMVKKCREHGDFQSLVERDATFYRFVQKHNAVMFYGGLIIDVTYRCNLRCKWCFQHLSADEVPKERIYALASEMPKGANIILSGGEPTLRADLKEIVQTLVDMGYCANVITNGYRMDWSIPCRWTLSYHPESHDIFHSRIREIRRQEKKIASIIYTDNSLTDFYQHVQEALSMADVCEVFRMHAAAPVGGNLVDQTAGIFVSDMHYMLREKGHELTIYPPKTIFVPMTVDTVPFMLISWQTAYNVDLVENCCEPWYHGRGGKIDNLVNRIIRDN